MKKILAAALIVAVLTASVASITASAATPSKSPANGASVQPVLYTNQTAPKPVAAKTAGRESQPNGSQNKEPRKYPNGTGEDYRSLLALRTDGYQSMTVSAFNSALLDWANANQDSINRIEEDYLRNDIQVTLSPEELAFITTTVRASNTENAMVTRSYYSGKPKQDPGMVAEFYKEEANESGYMAYCQLMCQFSYQSADEEKLTVGERDRCYAGMRDGIRNYWEDTGIETLLTMSKEDMTAQLKKIAKEYSTEAIKVRIDGWPNFLFEHADERHLC